MATLQSLQLVNRYKKIRYAVHILHYILYWPWNLSKPNAKRQNKSHWL